MSEINGFKVHYEDHKITKKTFCENKPFDCHGVFFKDFEEAKKYAKKQFIEEIAELENNIKKLSDMEIGDIYE